jgi:hypothetical protein
MDELIKKYEISLPSDEAFETFDQSLLDDLYRGLEPDDTIGKIKKCCKYLGEKVPDFKSTEEMNQFYHVIEFEYLNQACIDWHSENL